MGVELKEILDLPVAARIALAHEIWASLPEDRESLPLTPEQEEELDRRCEDYKAGRATFESWDDVKAKVQRKLEEIRRSRG